MKIERMGESYYSPMLTECTVYVGADLKVIKASESYYTYVGDNHYNPVSSHIAPEDGKLLFDYAENPTDKIELITYFTDKEGGCRNVYLRMEEVKRIKEEGPNFLITIYDICDVETRTKDVEVVLAKYRHLLTMNSEWCGQYFFEYKVESDWLEIYKYINERAMVVISDSLERFAKKMEEENSSTDEQKEQMQSFVDYLRNVTSSFEMEFTMHHQDKRSTCLVKGGSLYKNKKLVAGLMIPNTLAEKEAYYMTTAARDAGTGLFNKRAITEYTMERLRPNDGMVRWFILLDIDDFKDINDTFGHLFGDEVIRKVADVLQINVGYRGVVGRFGGDEFFVLLEKIPDRAALKNLLRTIIMELAYAFSTKLRIKVSMGISRYPADGCSYEMLFEKADKALYIAKEKGKNRHIIYDEKMHGELQKDEMTAMTVAYTVSREKRQEALLEILGNLYQHGAKYLAENPMVQKRLRDIYDLDGIAIYSDYGKQIVCRNGDYGEAAYDLSNLFQDENYVSMYTVNDNADVLLIHPTKLKGIHVQAYEQMVKQEIGTTIQCMARKDGKPYALVTFDMFNRNRKWSDADVEMLTLIGKCIGKMLCAE